MTKEEFVSGVLKRAAELREAKLLRQRSASFTKIVGGKRGRPPKPVDPEFREPATKDGLIDAFDEIEEPLPDSDISQ